VAAVESLCRARPLRGAEDKDTVRVELDLGDSGLRYAPGDALGIFPLNCPQARRGPAARARTTAVRKVRRAPLALEARAMSSASRCRLLRGQHLQILRNFVR
jgi:sulfite reductase alpha subunit-like flavoprotein